MDVWYSLDVWSRHHMEDGCYKNLLRLPKKYDLSTTLLIDDCSCVFCSLHSKVQGPFANQTSAQNQGMLRCCAMPCRVVSLRRVL